MAGTGPWPEPRGMEARQRDQVFTAITVAHNSEAMQKVGMAARDTASHPGRSDMAAIPRKADPPTVRPAKIELANTFVYHGLPSSVWRAEAVNRAMETERIWLIVPAGLLLKVG